MRRYKQDFIEFMVQAGVLTFGDFITKSGRETPFFINTGQYNTGMEMKQLGDYYAQALHETLGDDFDCLFGPAYKGIPLAVTTGVALAQSFHHDVGVAFNRKEAKDHGEGGSLIGHQLSDGDRVVIVEDVTTAGTSVRESVPLLKASAAVEVKALIVSVDRMERGRTERGALAELRDEFGLITIPIVTLDDIVGHLHNREINGAVLVDDTMKARIDAYRAEYGVRS
ncbi:MAG: orotate phosphoribosyltransferase [Lentisphaeria bacterium]|nr:orotate phosphoribosyltransferase [Lentisphaeria bacterium]